MSFVFILQFLLIIFYRVLFVLNFIASFKGSVFLCLNRVTAAAPALMWHEFL